MTPFPVWVSKKSWKARAGFLAILFTRLLVVGVFGTSFFGLLSRDSWLESPYYSGPSVRVRPHSGPPTPWFSWVFVRGCAGFGVLLRRFACSLGVGNRGFDSILHSRRRIIEPPKLLPTFLKDPYWNWTLCEFVFVIRTLGCVLLIPPCCAFYHFSAPESLHAA